MSAGTCRFCHRREGDLGKVPGGETAGWMDATRTVCTAAACQAAYFAEKRRQMSDAAAKHRKRTPAEIHQLKKEEKNAKQRAYRARKRNVHPGSAA